MLKLNPGCRLYVTVSCSLGSNISYSTCLECALSVSLESFPYTLFSHLTGFFTVFKAGFFMFACFYCLVCVFNWCWWSWSWCFGVGETALALQLTAAKLLFFFIAWKVNLIKTCSPWPLSFSSSSESNYTNTMCLWPHRLWCTSSCCHVELTLKPTVATVSSLFCLEKPIFAKIYHNQWARMGKSPQILL